LRRQQGHNGAQKQCAKETNQTCKIMCEFSILADCYATLRVFMKNFCKKNHPKKNFMEKNIQKKISEIFREFFF
jgi:hypothetical protein